MIRAEHLTLWYGGTRAVHDASFEVRPGEVLGMLGPNGAGKSTTLKILTTFLQPDEGRVVIDGVDASEDPLAVRRRIGYLPETAPLYTDMLVSEYLAFCASARGLSGRALTGRRDAVVESCHLEQVFHRPIGHLSKGFRQRVGLAQALIHDPDILILDEPTSGLDPLQILGIRELIRELAATKTILFSTHILQEIEAVSDRVMIISRGRIVAEGEPEELQRRAMGDDRLVVECDAPPDEVVGALSDCPGVLSAHPAGDGSRAVVVRHAFGDDDAIRHVDELVRSRHWPLRRLTPERSSLEEVFIALTSAADEPEALRDASATDEPENAEQGATDAVADEREEQR